MLLAPGVRSGRSHRCYFHWCVRSSHPCAPNIPNYQSVHVAPKSPNNSNWCLLRLKPCGPHSSMGLLEILNQIWGWLSDYGANPQIPRYKQSNNQTPLEYLEYMWPNGPIDIHINNWCNCTWTGNLQFTIHKFTNHKSNTCLDSGISCLTGQWFFVLVLHIHRHSNPTQWITSDQKKIIDSIGKNIQRVVMGPETGTKLSVLKDPSHHCPHKESSTGEVHLHLCDWPHDQCVFCHPCKRNCKH